MQPSGRDPAAQAQGSAGLDAVSVNRPATPVTALPCGRGHADLGSKRLDRGERHIPGAAWRPTVGLEQLQRHNWTLINAVHKSEAMAIDALDRLLTTLAVGPHACSVCQTQHGWGLAYSAFDAITIHLVLSGQGTLRVGTGPVLPFGARSTLVVPAHQPHGLGELGADVQLVRADAHCSMLDDALVPFTAGNGSQDILMLCGMISVSHSSALGLFDLLRESLIQDFSADPSMSPVFDLMLAEVTRPGMGTQAMTEVLMEAVPHRLAGAAFPARRRRLTVVHGLPASAAGPGRSRHSRSASRSAQRGQPG